MFLSVSLLFNRVTSDVSRRVPPTYGLDISSFNISKYILIVIWNIYIKTVTVRFRKKLFSQDPTGVLGLWPRIDFRTRSPFLARDPQIT